MILATAVVYATADPAISSTPTAKAFYRDPNIWPLNPATQTYDIPYCWENLAQIQANPTVNTRRKALPSLLTTTWAKYTRLRFYETTTPQCLSINHLPLYTGIRIRVDPNKSVTTLSGRKMSSPYVLALGTQIKNRQDGVVLDFSGSANLTLTCSIHFTSVDTCIKESIIHEFGHVIGISHEQNSNDTLPGGGCSDVASVNNKKDALV